MAMQRWKLTIEYHGSTYSGWQVQDNAPSIQGEIERAITAFCGQAIRIHVAGRTDAGVHARGQVAHFDLDYRTRDMSGFALAKAINAHLRPRPIAILSAEKVSDDFHARFSVIEKLYTYRLINRAAPAALDEGRAWHYRRPLDVGAMHDAAQVLVGRHDFTTFRDSECQARTPIRTVNSAAVDRNGDRIDFSFTGKSFLHHQVRNMAGTLTLVGEGKWTKEDFKAALEACDRRRGGMNAPPYGLYLTRITY